MNKICSKCKRELDIVNFYKDNNRKDSLDTYCKSCRKEVKKINNIKNPIKYSDRKEYYDKWRYTFTGRFSRTRQQANDRKINFALTLEDYLDFWDKKCYYCNLPSMGGIDRVDNNIGYELDNCIPCCWRCNVMKSNQNQQDFIWHCKAIVNNLEI